mmetsp:Transcript_70313/g.131519  ORF Transcript_70313/g.131519 Transcript_70313/m.131519 type:complete len:249 (-) Transcript_70313:424-1170(-)
MLLPPLPWWLLHTQVTYLDVALRQAEGYVPYIDVYTKKSFVTRLDCKLDSQAHHLRRRQKERTNKDKADPNHCLDKSHEVSDHAPRGVCCRWGHQDHCSTNHTDTAIQGEQGHVLNHRHCVRADHWLQVVVGIAGVVDLRGRPNEDWHEQAANRLQVHSEGAHQHAVLSPSRWVPMGLSYLKCSHARCHKEDANDGCQAEAHSSCHNGVPQHMFLFYYFQGFKHGENALAGGDCEEAKGHRKGALDSC